MKIGYINQWFTNYSVEEQFTFFQSKGIIPWVESEERGSDGVENVLDILNEEDILYVYQLESLGLTMGQLRTFLEKCAHKKIRFISVQDDLQIYDYATSEFIHILHVVVETDKKVKHNKLMKGMEEAKENGQVLGRPKLSEEKIQLIQQLFVEKRMSQRQIAQICHVSLGAVNKYVAPLKNEEYSF